MTGLISIIIPTYNRFEFIPATINSVFSQTYTNWELIVVDDRSYEEVQNKIRDLCAVDSRIRFYERRSETKGAPVCRNEGLGCANGEYIIFLDSDDVLLPDALHNRVEALESKSETGFVVSLCNEIFHEPGDSYNFINIRTDEDDLLRFVAGDTPWNTSCVMFRFDVVNNYQWDEKLVHAQDTDLFIRLLIEGISYLWIERVDVCKRNNDSSITTGNLYQFEQKAFSSIYRLRKTFLLLEENRLAEPKLMSYLRKAYFKTALKLIDSGYSSIVWIDGIPMFKDNIFEFLKCSLIILNHKLPLSGKLKRKMTEFFTSLKMPASEQRAVDMVDLMGDYHTEKQKLKRIGSYL